MLTGFMTGILMISVEGKHLDLTTCERLRHPAIGGVILFSRNFESPEQLTQLVAQIKAVKTPALLVAVDQEGGRVQRFRQGFTAVPAMQVIGRAFDQDPAAGCNAAHAAGQVIAGELRRYGIDISFAPVLDLYNERGAIGNRAFHSDPWVVRRLGDKLAKGMAEAGMTAVAKHFPGHSQVVEDPHLHLPVDSRSLNQIRECDLVPYRDLDCSLYGGIMTCHVLFSAVAPMPASCSHYWVQEELRGVLGYRGAVFSDDLLMVGASAAGTPSQRVTRALDAGSDMVLACNDDAAVDQILGTLGAFKPEVKRAQRLAPLAATGTTAVAADIDWAKAIKRLEQLTN